MPTACRKKRDLPAPAAGAFAIGYAIGADGRLARLCATADAQALARERRDGRQLFTNRQDGDEAPVLPAGTRAWIEVFDESTREDGPAFDLDTLIPVFDRLPDGRWVVSEVRCWAGDENTAVLDRAGQVVARFCLGDGISHLQCDADGGIWVGYFDEGVYGNLGWGHEGYPPPLGGTGLNLFDSTGNLVRAYTPPPYITDCYALNVAPDGVWLCPYDDFPILRVTPDGARGWKNEAVAGARAFAVEGDHVVLLGGYGENAHRIALLRLEGDQAAPVFECQLVEAGGSPKPPQFTAARGNELHVLTDETWYGLTVAAVRRLASGGKD